MIEKVLALLVACLEVASCGARDDPARRELRQRLQQKAQLSSEELGRFRAEIAYMLAKWRPLLQHDPYYNPNLTPWREDFSLKTPADVAEMQAFWRAFPALGQFASQRPSMPPTSRPRLEAGVRPAENRR